MVSFLKVPKKTHHALYLATSLAQAWRRRVSVSLEQVSRETGISAGFLERIAASLRRAKIITGQRGAGGGYRLTRPPRRITVADVVAAVEGPLALLDCVRDRRSCLLAGRCTNRNVWAVVQDQIGATLKRLTLADLTDASRD